MASQQAVSVHTCIREHMQGSLGLLPAIHPPHNFCRFAVQIGTGLLMVLYGQSLALVDK